MWYLRTGRIISQPIRAEVSGSGAERAGFTGPMQAGERKFSGSFAGILGYLEMHDALERATVNMRVLSGTEEIAKFLYTLKS